MIFKKLKIKNIRSYEEQEISFPKGSVLISGEVGSGKTSLLIAIEYALFGLQPGQKGSSILRNGKDFCEASLEFEVGGKKVFIERGLKRTSKGVSNDYASIIIDGERLESSVTEIKSKVVELLGYPPEFIKKNNILYRYTVYSPQEHMKQIITEDAETRIDILRHIFGIDRYKQIKENLSTLSLKLKEKSKILQAEVKGIDSEKSALSEVRAELKKISEKLDESFLDLEERKKNLISINSELKNLREKLEDKNLFEHELEKTSIFISTKKESLAHTLREIQKLSSSINENKEHFNKEEYLLVIKKIEQIKDSLGNLNSSYLENLSNITSLSKEQEKLFEKKDRVFKIDLCPTCLQNVSEFHKHNISNDVEKNLSELKKSLISLKEKRKLIEEEISKKNLELKYLEEKKLSLEILKSHLNQHEKDRNRLQELEKNKESLERDLVLLSEHIFGLKEKILKYSVFENQFKKKEEDAKLVALFEKNAEIEIAKMKKEQELLGKEMLRIENSLSEKEVLLKKLSSIDSLSDWLINSFTVLVDSIERTLLLRLRKEFSQLFRKWFLMLIPDSSLESQIDENFSPIILRNDIEIEYAFLSGGERTAVALAYRLALNQTINSFLSKIKTKGIIILDEPTDGFSESQIEKIRELLGELNAEQLILVSHEQKIEGFVDEVVRVSKDEDSSIISFPQNIYQKT